MKKGLFIFFAVSLVVAGCAAGPSVKSMIPPVNVESSVVSNKTLALGDVSGGKETNPMLVSTIDDKSFREALFQTLKGSGLFEKVTPEGRNEDYRLDAKILAQEVKSGVNTGATLLVRFELYQGAGEKAVWGENIFSQYEASFSESFYGVERARRANEGVVRNNLSQLIKNLSLFLQNQR